jgi:hypothetical protein
MGQDGPGRCYTTQSTRGGHVKSRLDIAQSKRGYLKKNGVSQK